MPHKNFVFDKTCDECGLPFTTMYGNKLYCGHRCSLRAKARRRRDADFSSLSERGLQRIGVENTSFTERTVGVALSSRDAEASQDRQTELLKEIGYASPEVPSIKKAPSK